MTFEKSKLHPELNQQKLKSFLVSSLRNPKMLKFSNSIIKHFIVGKNLTKNCHYRQQTIKLANQEDLRLCIYSSNKTTEPTYGLLWLYSGGYRTGSPELEFMYIERILAKSNCVIVCPDYTKSCDAPYPKALLQSYEALLWMNNNRDLLGVKEGCLAVGGDSAGGGLAAALALYARDKKEVKLDCQLLVYPMLDYRDTLTSQNNEAPIWNTKTNHDAWSLYLRNCGSDISKYASPALETTYHDLPQAIVYVGSLDPFYQEVNDYVSNLKAAGIKTTYKVFEGCYHAFDISSAKTKIANEAFDFLSESFNAVINASSKNQ